ncbi:hypothetical protein Lesp02_76730 [Lentzea sp. NBRC 105346]|uniref:pyridoxamine 5'-phosphate oxidase family protein n=1 Tax=Lentzea sp. NBRC 105346 TaxID=3032205 RepID=UPI0024A21699|nr:pyridoxamine 5'-phosphate oxidase family protein [Lentzea sp. NBRC 105346]GLZ35486.1 hypothetical protein Lesp02_76730 [Lentzea sp. NBRC 105346]
MTTLSPTARSTVQRGKHRAVTERSRLYEILDAGLICHLAVEVDGAPVVLPTAYGRHGNTLYLHGSTGARSLRELIAGKPVCVAVTLVDGVVYSRSVFHHSMNYRSAVVHGTAELAEDVELGLRAIVDHVSPGSWDYARNPNKKEIAKTAVLAIDLTEASVKVREGGPGEEPEDLAADAVWAGVLPLHTTWGSPISDDATSHDVPAHVSERGR